MSSDVVLTSALRSNLLSLQRTQSLIDSTQQRLATGLKVNSALDNPQSFFAAQSLNNRAGDLSRLLDGIGQAVSTIKAADEAVQSLTTLLDQAESLADEARSAIDSSSGEATITGNAAFTGATEFVDYANITDDDEIAFNFVKADGTAVTLTAASHDEGASTSVATIVIDAGETVDEVIAQINGIRDSDDNAVIKAELDADGQLKFTSLVEGGSFQVAFEDSGDAADTALATALGFGNTEYGTSNYDDQDNSGTQPAYTATVDQTRITVSNKSVLESHALYKSTGEVADASTYLFAAYKSDLSTRILNDSDATNGEVLDNSHIIVRVNGEAYQELAIPAATDNLEEYTIQDFVDGINNDTELKDKIEASFDTATGKISIRALDSSVRSVGIGIVDDDAESDHDSNLNLGFGINTLNAVVDDSGEADGVFTTEQIAFAPGAGTLAQLENDFDIVREQIDALVEDASYRGVNLLNDDDLIVYFNEDRSNLLTISGEDLSTSGLGISAASFTSSAAINSAITEVRDATSTVRNFASSLSTSLTVIQNRQDFTKNQINTLKEGADKLTLSDQNEEGANLLALQTRQALGTTALSLASQSAQSVLRLF